MNVTLKWTLPEPTAQQRPLSHVVIEGRVSADPELPWTELNTVSVPETELVLQDVAPGAWEYRGTVVDDDANQSAPVSASISVPFEGPSGLQDFTAQLS